MIWVIRLLVLAGALTLSGLAAAALAALGARLGLLGTCFEGACEYRAIFTAFPTLWAALFVAFLIGWAVYARRHAAP